VRVDAFHFEHRHFGKLGEECRQPAQGDSLPVRAGFDFQVNPGGEAGLFGSSGK